MNNSSIAHGRRPVRHHFPRGSSPPLPWIIPVFSEFTVNEHDLENKVPRHQHINDFEVIVVDRGVYHCRLNDLPLILQADEMLIVKPGDWHDDSYKPGLRIFSLHFHFNPDFLGAEAVRLFRATASLLQQRKRVDRSVFWPILERIQAESGTLDRFAAHVQDHLLGEFFWRLVRVLPPDAICPEFIGLSEEQSFRAEIQRLFQQNIHQHLSIEKMAQQLHMSTSSLATKCKVLFGLSPAHIFMQCKIERAQALLKNTDLPVKEIGVSLGFKNPYHFSRVFKQHTDRTPSDYREQTANGTSLPLCEQLLN